jgi:hypothetical protein
MRLAFNLDTRQIVDPDSPTTIVTTLSARRGEVLPLELTLIQGAQVVELEGAEVSVFITDATDVSMLVAKEEGITATGSGIETAFTGELDLDESTVDSLFATGSVLVAAATMEIRVETTTRSYRSEPVAVTIRNSYTAP